MMKKLLSSLAALSLSVGVNAADTTKQESKNSVCAYSNFLFEDPSFNFEAIRVLSESYYQAADIGEVIYVVKNIKNGDMNEWGTEWEKRADYIFKNAIKFNNEGNSIAAQNAYLRASNYYRSASFYMTSEKVRKKSVELREKSVDCFLQYIKNKEFISQVKIPYENSYLPGYFIKSSKLKNGKAPLIIINTGFDGTKEEICYQTGFAAALAGYNVLTFDGPGQGETIYKQKLFFRYDWEKVMTPAIDFAITLPEVDKDKIAVYGISMGGYLIPRAAAFDKRIKACIANGGIYDLYAAFTHNMPKEFAELAFNDPTLFNKEIEEADQKIVVLNWFVGNGMWTFNVNTPSDLMRALKQYNLKGVSEKISCDTLIVNGTADTFMQGEAIKLYDNLKCKKTYMLFDDESTGELHCQLGALAISNEKIFTWLNNTFGYEPYSKL